MSSNRTKYPCPMRLEGCTGQMSYRHAKGCQHCTGRVREAGKPVNQVSSDRERRQLKDRLASTDRKYAEALATIDRLEAQVEAMGHIESVDTFEIHAHKGSGTSEATPVIVASDWHGEERVRPETVSGLNEFTLDIFNKRVTKFWQSSLRLIQLLNQDVNINTVVIALLGDFITNNIHDELADLVQLPPMHALKLAQDHIISGLEFLRDNTKYNFVIPCHSGNHARTTRQTYFASENGHSLEYLMYLHLAGHFRNDPRFQFIISDSYHSYVKVYDKTIRFHHGHAVKYGGGVGGIFIPTYKAISQWNKARSVDLDVFGHFHQQKDGGNFVTNGSLIGYNGFAVAIKADYEQPKQTLFLMDKKRGRTCTWPILVE